MNWTGGARYRIKTQGERKLQKEFFDRKRFGELKSTSSKSSVKKKLSQDLLALYTVSRVHSKTKQEDEQTRSIKKVDLDKFQSCTRPVLEVDMGPSSPTPTPSRLFLMESKNSTPNKSGTYMYKTDTTNFKFTPQKNSAETLLRSDVLTKEKMKHGQSERCQHQQVSAPLSNLEIKFKSRTDTPDLKQKANQEENFECRRYKNRSRNTNFSFQHSSQKNRDTFDPFVSEDFQITPLKKYLKSDSPVSNSQLKKRRLSQSSSDRKDTVIPSSSKAKKAKTGLSCHYFTSTPLKGSNKTQEHRRSKQKFNLSAIERRFSPIDKLSKHIPELEDDFKYQPRPMVNTPETFNTKNQTPTFNVANMPAYEISGHDTSTTLNLTRNNKTPSEVSSISNLYESENIISGRKETSFLETVERSNVFLQCLSEDPTNVTLKSDSAFASNVTPKLENTTKITGGSDSSLMRYRQKFLQSEKVLKSHKQISDCNQIYSIPKPEVFTDETEKAKLTSPEFHYKPFRQEAYTKDKTLDIMKLYHKEKDITESRDSFHLNHTMTSEDMIVHTPVVTDHCLDESSSERKNSGGVATNYNRSPKVGEEYPTHLHVQNDRSICVPANETSQQEPDRVTQVLPGMNHWENVNDWDTPDIRNEKEKISKKTITVNGSHMDEVLQEMTELEKQDSVIHEETACDDISCYSNLTVAKQAEPSTELDEVDQYLDSEDRFWNNYNCKAAVENDIRDVNVKDQETCLEYQRSDQNINKTPTSDTNKNTIDTIHCESDEQTKCLRESNELPTLASEVLVSGVMELNVKDKEAIPIYEKLPSDSNTSEAEMHKSVLEETNTETSSSTSVVSDHKQDVDIDIVNLKANIFDDENQVSHNVDQNTDINDSLLQQEKLVGTESAMSAEKEESKYRYSVEMKVLSNSEYQQNSNDLVHSFGLELNTLDYVSKTAAVNSKYFNTPVIGAVKKVETSTCKTEAGTLQDPQVSSGCNQSVQTDRILSIDVASSPFVGHGSPISTKSIGIQCNFDTAESNNNVFAKDPSLGTFESKVPKLGSLAYTLLESKVPKLGSLANTLLESKVPKLGSLANTLLESKVPKLGSLANTLLGSNYWQGMGLVSFINRNLRGSSSTKESTISEELPEEGSYKHDTDMKTPAKEIKLEKSNEYNSDLVTDQDTKC